MATVKTVRRLVNPARRRARRSNPRRRLSVKQKLAGFGGKRAQAAARAARKRKRTTATTKPKSSTARARKPARKRAVRRRRSNPSEIIRLGLVNPARRPRRKKAVATKRRRRTNTAARRPTRRNRTRRANPVRARRRNYYPRRRRVRRRRNPSRVGAVTGMVQKAAWLIAGAVATRAVSQMVLRHRNEGFLGYLANAVAAFALGGVAGQVMKKREIGQLVTFGGVVALTLRAVQDFTPLGGYVQQQLALAGMRGDAGVGFLEPTTFFVPLAPADGRGATNARMALPAAVIPPAPAPASNGVSGLGYSNSRFGGRSRF